MRRTIAATILFAVTSFAYANGAMGLALEMFEYRTWAVYVIVTILLEAFLIGRFAGMDLKRSLLISVGANFLTGVLGVTGCLAPFFHIAIVGSQVNPNPFWNAVALLTLFGIASALVEMLVWTHYADLPKRSRTRGATLVAHLIGVPIALMILLVPERPYKGLEGFTMIPRGRYLRQHRYMEDVFRDDERIPKVDSVSELLEYVNSKYSVWKDEPELWVAGYVPEYHRFDTTEMRRHPMEINPEVVGKPLALKAEGSNWKWLVRYRMDGRRFYGGVMVDMNSGETKWSNGIQDFESPASSSPVH